MDEDWTMLMTENDGIHSCENRINFNQNLGEKTTEALDLPEGFLLAGEELIYKFEAIEENPEGIATGHLVITNYRLFFDTRNGDLELYSLPLGIIAKLETVDENTIQLYCKDIRCFRFQFFQAKYVSQFTEHLIGWSTCPKEEFFKKAFCFFNKQKLNSDGWQIYNLEREMHRLGLSFDEWSISNINENFEICKSYPKKLVVPKNACSDEILRSAALFRSSGRIPTLCWYNKRNGASICRSSQPLVGIMQARNNSDETLVNAVFGANPNKTPMYIIDCRARLSALANAAKGAGTERTENYNNCKLIYLNIDNIHTMRDSLRSLYELCQSDNKPWFSYLEATRWFEHLRLVLSGALQMATLIEQHDASLLVHCSDGWDRTSQLCSLAQILLDPFYRTLEGFEILIEKEWLSFGHKFSERCGNPCMNGRSFWEDYECSPIFVQWVDCVWQLMHQFPCSFEFNETLLLELLDHLYSCCYGTFLCNNENEREIFMVKKTPSLWSFINSNFSVYMNPFYRRNDQVLRPSFSVKKLQLWSGYYLRYHSKTQQMRAEEVYQRSVQAESKQVIMKLGKENEDLKSQLDQVKSELSKANLDRDEMKKVVNCTVYREEGGECLLIAKISSEDNKLVSKFCADLKGLQIIDDYDPNHTKDGAVLFSHLSEEDFVILRDSVLSGISVGGGLAAHSMIFANEETLEQLDSAVVSLEVSESVESSTSLGKQLQPPIVHRYRVRLRDYLSLYISQLPNFRNNIGKFLQPATNLSVPNLPNGLTATFQRSPFC